MVATVFLTVLDFKSLLYCPSAGQFFSISLLDFWLQFTMLPRDDSLYLELARSCEIVDCENSLC